MVKGFYILIWITVFKLCFCQLRMGLGNESVLGKKFLVYFVKSPYSEAGDDAWLCAGAIVSPTQILTAAACLVEVNRIYAIAGYKKYVHARDIEKDKCTNTWKKKVIKITVPEEYTTSTAKQLEWMNVDIGVATVQQPYDFNDLSYLIHCSYVPESIMINYDKSMEVENSRAIALGWGGKKAEGLKETEEDGLKPKLLQEATTNLIEKSFCTTFLSKNGSTELIEKYLICATGNGFLEDGDDTTPDPIRLNDTTDYIIESDEISSRKSSLQQTCQNDHGGPLVTWVGADEVILGVALNGICNPNFDCVGPRIYVSTASTAEMIKCMLETNDAQRKTCNDQIVEKRYQVHDIEIQWPENSNPNSTSSISNQNVSSVRRQYDNDEPLQERPTMDLRSIDNPQNPEDDSPENPQSNLQENLQRESEEKVFNSRKDNSQEDRELNPFYEPHNQPQADRSGGLVNEELKSQPEKQPTRFMTKQQPESQNQPEINSFNRPYPEYQNHPEIDTVNQPQMEPYNQPPMEPYYNQPASDSHYNEQIESKNPPEPDSYHQPQTIPKNQAPVPIDQNNHQMDSFNQPHMESLNQNQQPVNNHETKSKQPPRQTNNNQKAHAFKPPQSGQGPSQVNSYKQPRIESFGQPPVRQPQAKPFNKQQENSGSIKSSHTNGKPLSQSQYSNKAPQSPYNERIQAFDPEPAESYNPLDILMAQNQDEEITFKHPIVQPFKPPPVERHKLPSVDTYMPQPFKPSLHKTFEQPHLSQQYQQHPPQPAPALRQPIGQASEQPFEPNHPLNSLRGQPRVPVMHRPQGESQTFEQMYSQLHAEPELPEPVAPALPPQEETFDEIYRNLHDGKLDEPLQPRREQPFEQEFQSGIEQPIEQELQPRREQPIEQEFQSRIEQPIEQELQPRREQPIEQEFQSRIEQPIEQEFQPRMEQPIEQEVEQTDTRIMNEPPANVEVEANDAVQLRQQAPLNDPDYNK